jgi:hypothetical protein
MPRRTRLRHDLPIERLTSGPASPRIAGKLASAGLAGGHASVMKPWRGPSWRFTARERGMLRRNITATHSKYMLSHYFIRELDIDTTMPLSHC